MGAPALLLIYPGVADDAGAGLIRGLRVRLGGMRPDLLCRGTALVGGEPAPGQVVAHLIHAGATEIVLVPLSAACITAQEGLLALADRLAEAHLLPVTLAEPLGAAPALFALADARLRDALTVAHARELDGLVLFHDGPESGFDASALERRARIWAAHHRLPHRIASARSPLATAEAVASLAGEGRRHLGIANLSLACLPASLPLGELEVTVAPPLGADDAVLREVLNRYAVAGVRSLATPLAS